MSEWAAFEQIEGPVLGPRRDDLRAGTIAATIANVNRSKGSKAFAPGDFVLRFESPPEPVQAPEQQVSALQRYFELVPKQQRAPKKGRPL